MALQACLWLPATWVPNSLVFVVELRLLTRVQEVTGLTASETSAASETFTSATMAGKAPSQARKEVCIFEYAASSGDSD